MSTASNTTSYPVILFGILDCVMFNVRVTLKVPPPSATFCAVGLAVKLIVAKRDRVSRQVKPHMIRILFVTVYYLLS